MKKSDVLSTIAIIISIVALGVVLFAGHPCGRRPGPEGMGQPMMGRPNAGEMKGEPAKAPEMKGKDLDNKGPIHEARVKVERHMKK